ncbi:MAG: 50S ribosomal protein L15 [Candidatus Glassbacteria bacterium]|nr:50S ribosomal protein L15 [Candidatus Glassbacteria bacterium]
MKLSQLKRPEGSRKNRKRVGRGSGSGTGGTSGRGHKGQKSRSGVKIPVWFEGGQMPLQRRLPKRGFNNPFRKSFQVVNLSDLNRAQGRDKLGPAEMAELGLVRSANRPIKVLAGGEIEKGATIAAHAFSEAARKKIEAAGGKIEVI